jgi:hypothetical protein
MDITLYEFNPLNKFEKEEILQEHGVHISERQDAEYGYVLYQLNNFYVEVKYHNNRNEILMLTSFSNYTKLEPYLRDIDLSKIIGL